MTKFRVRMYRTVFEEAYETIEAGSKIEAERIAETRCMFKKDWGDADYEFEYDIVEEGKGELPPSRLLGMSQ